MNDDQLQDLQNRFAYHAPTGGKADKHSNLRLDCLALAKKVVAVVPPGREQASALTKLEEVMMWANAGIARKPEVADPSEIQGEHGPGV